jgi:hypothetical protein
LRKSFSSISTEVFVHTISGPPPKDLCRRRDRHPWLEVSIGELKSCFDKAAMEAWFASFKNEAIYPAGQPATRDEARTKLSVRAGLRHPEAELRSAMSRTRLATE